ncbi:MAG TPA: PilZ domain-containing protein [Vicinamibacterales bacterium]|nr:PilZ domain-containing protein [Vicinamibacterales bacterium]
MPSDVTIVIADSANMPAIRETASLPGRIMPFGSNSLGSAIESVRAYRPKVVAIDALVAQTPGGIAFLDRVEQLAIPGSKVLLLVEHDGHWSTAPRGNSGSMAQPKAGKHGGAHKQAAAANVVRPATPVEIVSTRRVPRFAVKDALDVTVESGCAHLVDISVLGAQVVSLPVLRPGQKIKVSLPDTDDTLNVVAQVAWSLFERTQLQVEPHYRVGLEFTEAAQQALEAYRHRHCTSQPLPQRGR